MKDKRKIIWEFKGITLREPAKQVKDPCLTCWAKDLCDAGECGRKNFKLFF